MTTAPSPWEINYFDPPNPHTPAPAPRVHAPKPVPGIEDLFRVQRNTLKVVNDIEDLQRHLGHLGEGEKKDHHLLALLRRAQHDAEDAYKVINTYLKHQTQGTL